MVVEFVWGFEEGEQQVVDLSQDDWFVVFACLPANVLFADHTMAEPIISTLIQSKQFVPSHACEG
jgi:hypothetical protein